MQTPQRFDLRHLFDTSPLQRAQLVVIVLCALVAMIDGFNVQSIALSAPEIARLWRLPPSTFGPVFSAGAMGNLLGTLIAGSCADRFGRRRVLLVSVLGFGLALLAMPHASSVLRLTLVWTGACLALGGSTPAIIVMTSEYAPTRLRATLVSVMMCGMAVGGVVGGIVASRLIPTFGWTSIFYLCSAVSLLMALVLFALLPESLRFLAMQGDRAGVSRIVDRLGWTHCWNGELAKGEQAPQAFVRALFRGQRAIGTALLWTTLILSLLVTFFLLNWLPILERQAGMGLRGAILGLSALNLGTICGCVIIGRLMDRFGPVVPIAAGYALGAAAVAFLGALGHSTVLLLLVAMLVGMTTVAAQFCMMALAAGFYPTALRATGVGWAHGVGKVGAVAGPLLGGILLAAGLSVQSVFVMGGLLSLGAACAVMGIKRVLPRTAPAATASAEAVG